ncbi:YbeD family protein [Dyella sp. 2RAB6]|uniref:YbeD family protein n=1 Tax=Dyella sp. 2RAB6 TaxID=3232992 RepID=UPI003F8FB89A
MQDIDSIKAQQEGQGFQFPGEFEITAMGNASADLATRVPAILEGIGLHVLHETVKHRNSREGNFLSVTVSFRCENREQYDLAHASLREDPDIRFTL